jgi:hypothetical protein
MIAITLIKQVNDARKHVLGVTYNRVFTEPSLTYLCYNHPVPYCVTKREGYDIGSSDTLNSDHGRHVHTRPSLPPCA